MQVIVDNMDALLDEPPFSAVAAMPYSSRLFNSGVFVFEPSLAVASALAALSRATDTGAMPWLLKDLAVKTSDFAGLTEGAEVPPNPVDGPSIAVVSAQVLKERGFGFYVAISADVEGDGNFTYVARTATANPVNEAYW